MASVTFPVNLGGDGSTVSDDANPTTGLANGGHRTRFVPALSQFVIVADQSIYWGQTALTASQTALNAPATQATSTTSLTISTGSKSLTLAQTGKAFVLGQYVIITSTASPTNWMIGAITAFTAGTGAMTVNVTNIGGSGTIAAWSVTPSGPPTLPTQTGQSGKFLRTNGTDASWQFAVPTLVVVTATTQAAVADAHYVLTSASATTVTLPASPTAGDTVWVTVGNGRIDNIVARNAQNIMGLAEDMTINNQNATVQLRFINASLGWRLL